MHDMKWSLLIILFLSLILQHGNAFCLSRTARATSARTVNSPVRMTNPIFDYFPQLHFADGLVNAVKSLESGSPDENFGQAIASSLRAKMPAEAIRWFHPLVFSGLTLSLGLAGLKYGIDIKKFRQKRGVTAKDYKTARDLHPQLMGALLVTAIIGTQSGLFSALALKVPLLESWHSVSAVALTAGLAGQAVTGKMLHSDGRNDVLRTAHRIFGIGSMSILFAHLATGLQLALSIDTNSSDN